MRIALIFIVGAIAFGVGTVFGRELEREVVGYTLAEFAKVDAAARATFERLSTKLGYLKKYL